MITEGKKTHLIIDMIGMNLELWNARLLQFGKHVMLELTSERVFDEHPEGYEGSCLCAACLKNLYGVDRAFRYT